MDALYTLVLFSCIFMWTILKFSMRMAGPGSSKKMSEKYKTQDSLRSSILLVFCGFYLPLGDGDYYPGERWEFRDALCVISSPMSGI